MYDDSDACLYGSVTIERIDAIVNGETRIGRERIVTDASAHEPHVATWLVHAIEDATAILWPAA